jgi:anti-anti-sigma factor
MEPKHDLSITSEEWRGWHVVFLTGKFVVKSIAQVRNKFDEFEAGQTPRVAVDMSGVTQIDSSALTVVLNLQKRLRQKKGEAVVIGPADEIKETLYLVGFNMAVPIYSSRAVFEQATVAK